MSKTAAALAMQRRPLAGAVALAVALAIALSAPAQAAPGDLDPTFGTDGTVTTNGVLDGANAVALQPDGFIVAVGYATAGPGFDWGLARYKPDGRLDLTFGSSGTLTTDFGGNYDYATAVGLQADGRIVVAGIEGNDSGAGRDFALARYNPDGGLDVSFGSGGKVTTDFAGAEDNALGMVLQPDGRIVVVGYSSRGPSDFALARYNPDGSLDTSFGSGGRVTTEFGGFDLGYAVALQPDGRIVVAGSSGSGTNSDFALARYHPNGSPDTAFGSGGRVTTDLSGFDTGYAVALKPDGRILVTGPVSHPTRSNDFGLAGYNRDGGLDEAFGSGGKVITDFAGESDIPYTVAVQPDGRILVAGHAGIRGPDVFLDYREDFALARYSLDGSLDAGFGSGGKVTTNIGADSDNDTANALALQPEGRIVLAGAGGGGTFALARYLNASGRAPTVRVLGGDCRENDASAVVRLSLADRDTPAGDLTVAATSSNPALLADLTVAGNGASRTLALSGARKRSGTATVAALSRRRRQHDHTGSEDRGRHPQGRDTERR